MASLSQILDWFKTGKKPTQAQFWASWGSFWHKEETIPQSAISNLTNTLNAKAERAQLDAHKVAVDAHADLFEGKEDKSKRGTALGYAPLDEFTKLATEYLNVVNDLVTGGESSILTAEQGKVLQNQINNINVLLASDNVNLDNVQELVDAIETIQMSLSSILVNDLTTGGTTKALTAEMGKVLELTKENISNKTTMILEGTNESSDTLFPTIKAVYDWCIARFQKLLLNIETTAVILYTLEYTNLAKRTVFTSNNPVAVTIPTNSVSSIPVGAKWELTAQGEGEVTIGGAGISFTTNLSLSMVKGETRILTKIGVDTWTVEGNITAAASPYKKYSAIIKQTNNSAPTAHVLENSLGGVSFVYTSYGRYTAMLTNAILNSEFFTCPQNSLVFKGASSDMYALQVVQNGENNIDIFTRDPSSGASLNNVIDGIYIEFRVY